MPLPFPDLDQSVKDDVKTVEDSKLVAPDTKVYGYVYDVKTGKVNQVA
jgi:carbonic anhydrase